MSIRRTRKKRVMDQINNEQQAAKEKLFEISYLDEGRLEDSSEILIQDRRQELLLGDDDKLSIRKGRKKVEKKKSNSLAHRDTLMLPMENYYEDASSARGNKKSRTNTQGEGKSIINTIESNRVFVGNKKYNSARTHTDAPNNLRNKGGEAMPLIKPKSFVQLQKIDQSPSHLIQVKLNGQFPKNDRWRLAQLFTNKNADRISYIQIKTKLRRELLGNTQEKLTRKYEFFA